MDRLIAIGDIHGEIDKLNSLLDKIKPDEKDKIIFLGDYIDRGKNSKEVIDKLIDLAKTTECIFLMGNHEEMLLNLLKTKKQEDIEMWLLSGGVQTFDNYGGFVEIFSLHKDFLTSLKPYYLTEKYLFVHAGIRPDKPLEEQDKTDMLWIRDNFISHKHCLKQKVIFGHTPFYTPYIEDDKIGINTGCGIESDGYLTALICDDETFITSN